MKSDDIWLSPNYQRDSCHMTLCIHNPSQVMKETYFFGFFRAVERFEPRVHWGKEFSLTSYEANAAYPKLKEFLKVREKLDPKGMFLNNVLAKTFGLN